MRARLLSGIGALMLLLPAHSALSAEVGKGTYEVDFRGELTTTTTSGSSRTRFVLEPCVGYFLDDAVEIGVAGRLVTGNGALLLGTLGFASLHFKRTEAVLY